jgi:hypothetical protein
MDHLRLLWVLGVHSTCPVAPADFRYGLSQLQDFERHDGGLLGGLGAEFVAERSR